MRASTLFFFCRCGNVQGRKMNSPLTLINTNNEYQLLIININNYLYSIQNFFCQETSTKVSKKERETKAAQLYTSQEEIARQQETIEKYEKRLAELTKFREEKESRIVETKDLRKLMKNELDIEKNTAAKFNQEIESLRSTYHHFEEWEKEIVNHLKISKRMSEKEATLQRELLGRKQQEDYVLMNLMEEVSRLENEIKDCREQLAIKEAERIDAGQTITDANTDLEGLQRTQKKLFSEWNHVVASISQRDKVHDELLKERA